MTATMKMQVIYLVMTAYAIMECIVLRQEKRSTDFLELFNEIEVKNIINSY